MMSWTPPRLHFRILSAKRTKLNVFKAKIISKISIKLKHGSYQPETELNTCNDKVENDRRKNDISCNYVVILFFYFRWCSLLSDMFLYYK